MAASLLKAKAVELAVKGHTYDTIAREVGYANHGTAHRVVRQALDEHVAEDVDELRATEVARLDALQPRCGRRRWPGTSRPTGSSPC